MFAELATSEFRVEKLRATGELTLSSGRSARGNFFTAAASAHHDGPELVGELLNSEAGFFPFEIHDADRVRTVLFHRSHVVIVELADNEASRDPGYSVATERVVSVLLSSGRRLIGAVRVYAPEGHDRVSDWARLRGTFRYLETTEATFIVNTAHIVEVSEVSEP
jgi:hypothetical protein